MTSFLSSLWTKLLNWSSETLLTQPSYEYKYHFGVFLVSSVVFHCDYFIFLVDNCRILKHVRMFKDDLLGNVIFNLLLIWWILNPRSRFPDDCVRKLTCKHERNEYWKEQLFVKSSVTENSFEWVKKEVASERTFVNAIHFEIILYTYEKLLNQYPQL